MKPLFLLFAFASVALAGAQGPRQRIRFDDGWLFHVVQETEVPATDSPSAWSFRPAEVDRLDLWELPKNLSSGEWKPIKPGQNAFASGQKFVWLRADVGKGGPPGQRLMFDGVDDNAVVFLNGRRLIMHKGWDEPFSVLVASAWREDGPNTVVLLVENTDGTGGLNGGVRLDVPRPLVIPREAEPNFDECWGTVHLPHDYVVAGTFDPDGDTGHGSLPKPTAWYRKTFKLPASDRNKRVWVDFDGVYRNAEVYFNGVRLGKETSGYIGFRYDLTRLLKFDEPNILAVHVDPSKNEGWWYEGGGIYRHVWLDIADPSHIEPDSVWVRTETAGPEEAPIIATISTGASFVFSDRGHELKVASKVIGPDGRTVASMEVVPSTERPVSKKSPDGGRDQIPDDSDSHRTHTIWPVQRFVIPKPVLWSVENPNLYTLETSLYRNGKLVDRVTTPFGIRTMRFDKDKGFFLNGKHTMLKGTCNHQDHAGVGIAIPDRLFEWRIKRLKSMGSNAYRCSHNPPAKELLDACDRLGMLVLDETRHLGDATSPKTSSGTAAWSLSELKRMILRDRNHPSIFAWSLYNEEPLQGTPEGAKLFAAMEKVVKELDPTRPCTGADNGGYGGGIVDVTGLFGFNYNIWAYDQVRAKHPDLPLFGSETASALSTRGIYATDKERGYVSTYDVNKPSWGNTAEEAWTAIASRPFMAGAFVWTGFDYKGEPTPYGWPCINSHFGILDICGFPKDTFWYYKAWWGDEPSIHVFPHWNWPGQEGKTVKVWVHSNAEMVELFLNGQSLGVKEMPRLGHLEWDVPYAPGRLEARGVTKGTTITDRVETTGPPAAIRLKTDYAKLVADEEDTTPVEVEIVDAEGRVVPTADNLVEFTVEGPGRIAGVGNGDPSSHEPDRAFQRSAFNGLCMALLQTKDKPGKIVLRAESPGLKGATLEILSVAATR